MKNALQINRYSFFAIFCGLVATLWQYNFGDGDQLDYLLFVYKALDANFLNNDLYVSLATSFSVRFYFAHFVAIWARIFGIAGASFALTLIANILLSYLSFLVAKLISNNTVSGLVASILVMTLTTINMGDVPTLYATGLAPDRLAFPLVLAAFYFALKGKIMHVGFFAGMASIFHIMLGTVTGGVILIAMLLVELYSKQRFHFARYLKALVVLMCFSLLTFLPYIFVTRQAISADKFINTYAFFRVPHHLVPSYIFANGILLRSLAFFMGASMAGILLSKHKFVEGRVIRFFVFTAGLFFILCFFGFLFIEVIPSRLGVLLQAFRYLTFVKWMALIMVGSYAGKMLSEKQTLVAGLYLFASVLSPFLMCFSFCFEAFYQNVKQFHSKTKYTPYLGLILVLLYLSYKAVNPETVVLIIYLVLILVLAYFQKKISLSLVGMYLVFVILNVVYISKSDLHTAWFTQNFNPTFDFSKYNNAKVDMALYIKGEIEKEAKLLGPPNMLEIRTIGEHAAVSCFKTVPFGDTDIREWKERLDFCYGTTDKVGFEAEQDLVEKYKCISDADLERIKLQYGIDYAVLFNTTQTAFKTVYQNEQYKLVKVGN